MSKHEILVLGAARTAIGSFMGALSAVPTPQLGSAAIRGALKNAGMKPEAVTEVILGNVLQAGEGQATARQATLGAGLPTSTGSTTINKVCGSGMKSVILGMQSIALGDSQVVVSGGMESMSRAPYLLPTARVGMRMGNAAAVDSMINDGLWDPYQQKHMGNHAESCAKKYDFTREAQDAYAASSFKRALEAQKSGAFKREIVPFEIEGKKGDKVIVDTDEGPSKVNFEKMPSLKPAFDKTGTVTAANASTINDGAAALVLASKEKAAELGVKPIAKLVSWGTHSQDPEWFTTSPVQAAKNAIARAGWKTSDVDLFEVNEAFAVVAMAFEKEMGISRDKLNVNGGAISLGHPIGASGARILVTLIHALQARGLKKGCAAICIGGGEGLSVCVEIA